MAVGAEDEGLVGGERLHYAPGVAGGYHDVAEGLYGGGGVHVGHDLVLRVCLDEGFEVGGGAALGQGAGGGGVGGEHGFPWAENLAGLGHEVYAAHDDGVG